ncbi:hypothetical protein K503DRAFT_576242 [Rhizopogon vinicolor AM-OR11-026]|uniref:Uncharacterized protein n=1 Tax=Rhizopogon vinicolor AM-OR11-026 TaxID=1314800 RepID=A0A1B7MJP3_9AGAM|nr:hypothetical protein K503DRAFT_576242 [Rhizopogon vinicolor AM-OR11-026]
MREETVHPFLIVCPFHARQATRRDRPSRQSAREPPERSKVHQTTIPPHSKHPQTGTGFWRRRPTQR